MAESPFAAGPGPDWMLIWTDEFDRLDPLGPGSCWEAQLGDGSEAQTPGWGNHERQWYMARKENLRIEGGQLVIQARRDDPPAVPGQPYTSARIRTCGRISAAPSPGSCVRVEARLKATPGPGLWPAFWMLPETKETRSGAGSYGNWAASGEIDVVEMRNSMQEVIGSIHFGGTWPHNACLSGSTNVAPPQPSGDFHVYAVEWDSTTMRWFLDGRQYHEARSAGGGREGGWWSGGTGAGPDSPFDQPFHLLLNLALASEATPFTSEAGVPVTEAQLQARLADPINNPALLVVDWVRVYERSSGAG